MVDRFLARLSDLLGIASSLAVVGITIAIVIDVVGRRLWSAPLDGASEFAVAALVVVVFLGLAPAQRIGGNFRVDMLLRVLPAGGQRALEVFWRLLALGMVALLAWLASGEAIRSTEMGEASYGVVAFPVWPSRLVLAGGLWVLVVQLVVELARLLLGKTPRAEADAAPGPDYA